MIMMTTYTTTASSKGKKPYKSWLKDGVNGGPSSMDVLVNWLSKKANYAKWKGDDCERIPKKLLLENIIEQMRDVGIYHRLAKDVASKISTLQSNYRLTREWRDTDGKKLLETGASEEAIHEELLKRFPYWDALHEVFNHTRPSAWPMSIKSIMHAEEEKEYHHKYLAKEEDELDEVDYMDDDHLTKRRRRKFSDNSIIHGSTSPSSSSSSTTAPHIINIPASNHTDTSDSSSTHSLPPPPPPPPLVIRPLPRVISSPPSSHHPHRDTILAESLLQVTREKEAGRMKRSQDMLQFLREKRVERDQLLIEKEKTKRVKARADLVKNLMEAGFDKDSIAEQLNKL